LAFFVFVFSGGADERENAADTKTNAVGGGTRFFDQARGIDALTRNKIFAFLLYRPSWFNTL
jgi:hypothetical protein